MPPRLEPPHRVLLVEWLDASDAFPTWARADSLKRSDREQLVTSVGYLVEDTDEWLTLATSCVDAGDDEHFGGGIHIPKALVRRSCELDR
jgi:hypothetical protein